MKARDPRFKLLAFGLLLPVLMDSSVFSALWLAGSLLVVVATVLASLSLRVILRGLWRLRWLFLAMMLTHGWFTPGLPLWPMGPALTQEGIVAGLNQSLRLVMLFLLAWSLTKTTTPMELVGAFATFFGKLERFGVPVWRGLSVLAFCLSTLPTLMLQVEQIREGMALRIHADGFGWLERLAFVGEALLLQVLWGVRQQEEGIMARGFGDALPPVRLLSRQQDWRDWSVVVPPVVLWLIW